MAHLQPVQAHWMPVTQHDMQNATISEPHPAHVPGAPIDFRLGVSDVTVSSPNTGAYVQHPYGRATYSVPHPVTAVPVITAVHSVADGPRVTPLTSALERDVWGTGETPRQLLATPFIHFFPEGLQRKVTKHVNFEKALQDRKVWCEDRYDAPVVSTVLHELTARREAAVFAVGAVATSTEGIRGYIPALEAVAAVREYLSLLFGLMKPFSLDKILEREHSYDRRTSTEASAAGSPIIPGASAVGVGLSPAQQQPSSAYGYSAAASESVGGGISLRYAVKFSWTDTIPLKPKTIIRVNDVAFEVLNILIALGLHILRSVSAHGTLLNSDARCSDESLIRQAFDTCLLAASVFGCMRTADPPELMQTGFRNSLMHCLGGNVSTDCQEVHSSVEAFAFNMFLLSCFAGRPTSSVKDNCPSLLLALLQAFSLMEMLEYHALGTAQELSVRSALLQRNLNLRVVSGLCLDARDKYQLALHAAHHIDDNIKKSTAAKWVHYLWSKTALYDTFGWYFWALEMSDEHQVAEAICCLRHARSLLDTLPDICKHFAEAKPKTSAASMTAEVHHIKNTIDARVFDMSHLYHGPVPAVSELRETPVSRSLITEASVHRFTYPPLSHLWSERVFASVSAHHVEHLKPTEKKKIVTCQIM